ncbi:unnamed protein product (macronuclear) [Paramecium tetraurelia]|uniref:CBF1-interacting co-repressor CIR N-terminal domain-containing protein n=1 Tax=Paramecium tetraurelia TaxID=5888 RepID=A0BFR9_PARTE|nr:uncharacterized protein GSPATT00028421001 [Paramecium tetraurelia]CAK57386.1 unnamed protein product [Paramecium tetraurelia]|eukprot:XP_001424784.1 hypothetical protein (macronuclear) [Paramecium tetraurelia strain d4-2]
MKRTKETFFREHPDWQYRQGVSGLKEFDGEDLQYDSRNQHNKEQQKQWIFDQIEEKKRRQDQEKAEEQAYAQQTLEINRFRGMLQDNFASRKTDMGVATKQTNLQLAKEKKDKEEREKQEKLAAERAERDLLLQRGRKQPYNG